VGIAAIRDRRTFHSDGRTYDNPTDEESGGQTSRRTLRVISVASVADHRAGCALPIAICTNCLTADA